MPKHPEDKAEETPMRSRTLELVPATCISDKKSDQEINIVKLGNAQRSRYHFRKKGNLLESKRSLRQALDADVPEGWITGAGEGEYEGLVYYYNEATGESTWDHPLDEYYRC